MIRKIDACLRYYLHVPNPELLSDEDWAARFSELVWIRKTEAEANTIK